MRDRVALAQNLVHVGLLVMLLAAIASAALGSAKSIGWAVAMMMAGACLATVARIWRSHLERSIRQHNTRAGVWAIR